MTRAKERKKQNTRTRGGKVGDLGRVGDEIVFEKHCERREEKENKVLFPVKGVSGLCGWVILLRPYCQHDSWQKSPAGGNAANQDQLLLVAKASVLYHCQRNSHLQTLRKKSKQPTLVDVSPLVDSNEDPEPRGMERLNREQGFSAG